jgi:voltage-gated potassium channel
MLPAKAPKRCIMRFLVGILATIVRTHRQRRNLRLLAWLGLTFAVLLGTFSLIFHWLMAREGQEHSWVTAVYWTFVTMSTLGFGDITFTSDAGRLFTIVVLITGTIFLLVLLPFSFIQFFFLPWMEASEAADTPRKMPDDTRGHVVLTQLGPIEEALVRLLTAGGVDHCVIVPDTAAAGPLLDSGYSVMVGPFDDPDTYRSARVAEARLVATTLGDTTNTNVTFTVREVSPDVPIVATASSEASVDILTMAGCTQVMQLGRMLGDAMARRVLGRDGRARVVGHFDDLLIAEASVAASGLSGKTLAEIDLHARTGVTVVGIWHRGGLTIPTASVPLPSAGMFVLAGSREALQRYDAAFAEGDTEAGETLIIGGGRVGRAVASALRAEGRRWRLVEKDTSRIRWPEQSVVGDAARREVLERAGIGDCSSVVITTRDDDMNIYLTLYCRKLRPDVQIIARSTRERNVETLHRAGADFVMSYATTGATTVANLLRQVDILMVSEGLHLFRLDTPPALVGRSLAEAGIREASGCTVIAVGRADHVESSLDLKRPLTADSELVLLGDDESENRFMARFGRPTV